MTERLEISNFNGGITDFHINAPENRYQKGDNFLIVRYGDVGKLFTRPGSRIYDSINYQIPAGAQRIGTLKFFRSTLLIHSARKFYYISPTWQTLLGPTGNDVFPAGNTVNNIVSLAEWNSHLFVTSDNLTKPQKIYKDGSNVFQLRTAGMPPLASSPTIVSGGVGNTHTFIYAFYYRYTYTVENRTFEDFGPTRQVLAQNVGDPAVDTNVISNIPVLANGATDNYDTASINLVVDIYRTVENGTEFFKVGQVQNGTTTYTDSTSDANLVNNESIYTSGGVPDNDPPPPCKVLHVAGQYGYYGYIQEGSDILKNRVRQSVASDIDSAPATFFTDVEDDVVAISSVKDTPIILGSKNAYRIDGVYDELGRGGMFAQKISNTANCISSQSVVQTLDGVFWWGSDGVYFTDSFQVIKVSKDWSQTYQAIVSLVSKPQAQVRIQGKYDGVNRRIYWSVWESATSADVDKCYVLDLNWGISDTGMPFTSLSGNVYFSPTAIEFLDGNMIRGDRRGYLFQHLDSLYEDPRIVVGTNPSTWGTVTILYDYRSPAFNLGTDLVRKLVPRATILAKNETNLSLQIVSNNDDGRRIANCAAIRYRGNITWGDPDVIWGDPNLVWNRAGLIDDWRHFPAKSLRCSIKQIYLQNAFVAVVNSDLLGQAVVNNVAKTATLVNAVTADWPAKALDFYLSFASDGYVNNYLVTVRTDNVLTFTDPMGSAPSGTQSWVLRGYPKGEILNLIGYVIHFIPFGESQHVFKTSETGEVGAANGDD